MEENKAFDAVVVGAGPNGLGAAIELARAGLAVVVYEAEARWGGGARSEELTLPGYVHDVCSAVHPMAVATQFLPSLPLAEFGLEWVHPPLALAHPFEDGTVAVLQRSGAVTAERLGEDSANYRRLLGPVVRDWVAIEAGALAAAHWPGQLLPLSRFGLRAVRSARGLAEGVFTAAAGRALFAGLAAHAMQPLEAPGTAAIGLILGGAAHRAGWPLVRGGTQRLADAMVGYLRSLGGQVVTGRRIASLAELPAARAVLCDLSPRGLIAVCGQRMPAGYRRALRRFEAGPGVYKLDWALRGPIPWRAEECGQAGTVHLGGTLEEIAASEAASCARRGARTAERPFVILSQPSLFDPTRAPAGRHTAWAYCHVPNGSGEDMAGRIEAQVERFAPGFRELILARSARGPGEMERHNANLAGGDIGGGRNGMGQWLRRPTWRAYSTPMAGIYLCSASTPPGGGVHGLCGYHAARRALREGLR
ncbi:MAG TPA: NAD(P)/FAD-dependent oxidoreductase [Terriglobales bacterium]|nr:NAD(P)/FAD-dependent oxidoreductase [Terriglobales bacterium]